MGKVRVGGDEGFDCGASGGDLRRGCGGEDGGGEILSYPIKPQLTPPSNYSNLHNC